jgi:methyl-accepting chemotaxis protein
VAEDRRPDAVPALLRPVLALASRWNTSARLTVLAVLMLVPGIFATWSFTATIGGQVAFSDRERSGNRVLAAALDAMAATAAGDRVDLEAVHRAVAAEPDLDLATALEGVRTTAAAADSATPAGRARVNVALAALVTAVGNDSNLILDPDLDSFYVMDALVVQLPKALRVSTDAAVPPAETGTARVAAQALRAGELASAADAISGDVDTAVRQTSRAGLSEDLSSLAAVADAVTALSTQVTAALGSDRTGDPAAVGGAAAAAVAPATAALDDLLRARVEGLAGRRDVTLAVTVAGLLLAFWFALGVRWRTRHDVALALDGVTAIADGDLSDRPVPASRDEFGAIGRALDVARRRLASQEREIAETRESRERGLLRSFAQQRMAQQHVRKQAQRAIDETAEAVVRELTEVMAQVEQVRESAGAIESQVSAANGITQAMVDQSAQAGGVVERLEQNLRNVAGMAKLISGVADQTKLLALNATIEAARAGEAGQGFSVVAGEVKQLATTTASSTEEIAATVSSLEADAAAMLASVHGVGFGVGEVTGTTAALAEVAQRQHDVVGQLSSSVGDALERIRSMSSVTARLDRRASERLPARGFAEVHVEGTRYPAELADVSATGARLIATDVIPVGASGVVRVDLPLGSEGVVVEAEVVRDRLDGDQQELGLRFLRLTPVVSARIEAFLTAAASYIEDQAVS